MRPAGQHRRRQAQLLSPYSSSFCNFSGKNISFVRTPFSVSSLLLISVTVPVSLLAIVTDDTSPLFILHICLFVPGPHCLTLYVLLGNSLPLPKPCSHIFFSSLCQFPCLFLARHISRTPCCQDMMCVAQGSQPAVGEVWC